MTIFGIFIFNTLAQALEKEFDVTLYNYAVDVSETIILEPTGDLSITVPKVDREKIFPFVLGTSLIQIRHINGQIMTQVGTFGGWEIPYRDEFKRLSLGEESTYRTEERLEGLPNAEAESYRIVSFPVDNSPAPQLVLQVAVPLTFLEAQLDSRRLMLEAGIPILLILATLVGFIMSSRALAPVTQIIQTAKEIGPGDFSKRVPIGFAKDEIQALALTVNEMLERIENAFQSQERFVADASHQLLTPLTICRAEIEQALKNFRTASPEQIEAALQSSREELNHLTHLIKDLLLLAQIDAGLGALSLLPVNFLDIVFEAAERAEKIARNKQVRIKVTFQMANADEIQIKGDEDLLKNLIFNLLENGVKYTPAGSLVSVEVSSIDEVICLLVKDEGPGLPASGTERLFERFSRGTDGKGPTGYGLGLAISKKIADLHQAQLSGQNRTDGPGAIFQLQIKNN